MIGPSDVGHGVVSRAMGTPGTTRFALAGLFRAVVADWAAALREVRASVAAPTSAPRGLAMKRGLTRVEAECQAGASVQGVHLQTLSWLVGVLESAEIPYWTMRRDETFADIGLPAEFRVSFLNALRRTTAGGIPASFILGKQAHRTATGDAQVWRPPARSSGSAPLQVPRRAVISAAVSEAMVEGDAFGAVLPKVDPRGHRMILEEAEVRVGFWSCSAGGKRLAPEPNSWASTLEPETLVGDVYVDVHGVRARTLTDLDFPHVEHVAFPIDVVYTWVNGADPAWQERMQARSGTPGSGLIDAAKNEDRFRSIDELKFSLRSVHQNAPWVRRVWIVTDQQHPTWLREVDDRVTVIDHREIWADPSDLPVFNSHAIETQLHHIPGLSEHYVYLNDDVFLTAPLRPTAFFSAGGVMRIFSSPVHVGLGSWPAGGSAVEAADRNDWRLLRDSTSSGQTQRLRHTGHAQRRSVAEELEGRFPDEFARTAASTFRSPGDISPIALHSWYALRTGRAVISDDVRLAYVNLAAPTALRTIRSLRPELFDFVCLNRTEASSGRVAEERAASALLERHFPFVAPWEVL